MAELNGKTPEQIAKDVIEQATKDVKVSISGTSAQKLEVIVKYLNRDTILTRGENYFKKSVEALTTNALEELIEARHKAIVSYLAKREQEELDKTFHMLRKRGMSVQDAYAAVYKSN